MPPKRKVESPISGYCFCITGTLSVTRNAFEQLIVDGGGSTAKSINSHVTHLVCAPEVWGTKKCIDAQARGVCVVDEDWVRAMLSPGTSIAPPPVSTATTVAAKKVKKEPTAAAAAPAASAPVASAPAAYVTGGSGAAAAAAAAASMQRIYLECDSSSGGKFWRCRINNATTYVTYGKVGACGVTQLKEHDDATGALKYYTKISNEKLKKGYTVCSDPDYGPPTAVYPTLPLPASPPLHANAPNAAAPAAKRAKKELVASTTTTSAATATVARHIDGAAADAASINNVTGSTVCLVYLELIEGSSDKFYELKMQGTSVTIRYGRRGTPGTYSEKFFGSEAEAQKFVDKTAKEKRNKGYADAFIDDTGATAEVEEDGDDAKPLIVEASDEQSDPRSDLEAGKKVFITGSGKLPYTLRKFNGGYSCSCKGFTMNIKRNGVQATSCKHLKLVRGEEAEAIRCEEFCGGGGGNSSSRGGGAVSASTTDNMTNKNTAVVKKISLANAWKLGTDPSGFIMSEKLDGMRAYWSKGKLWTRSGGGIAAPDWFLQGLPTDIELDGELFLGRQQFDACMSIARRSDASDDWRRLTYVIFDAPLIAGGIAERLSAVEAFIHPNRTPHARIHPQEVCKGVDHLLEELARVEQLGGEGLMLRVAMNAHRGGRSNDLLKVKSFHDDEALITAYEEGNGKYKGMIGSLVCILKDGSAFKVGSGLSDVQRVYRNAPKIGSVITFKYFELTKDGIPRFPTFLRIRPDVNASEFPQGEK